MPETLPSVIMGPPAYASPDPKTNSGMLVPLEDHPLSADISEDYAANEIDLGHEMSLPSSMTDGNEAGASADPRAEFGEDGPDTKADWQKVARGYGLSTSGSKADLQERVEEHESAVASDKEMTAADWNAQVDEAQDADELAALRTRYEAAGGGYSTVDAAFDKAYAELNEQ